MSRRRAWLIPLGVVAGVALGVIRHGRRSMGKKVAGGILVSNAAVYDALAHRLLLRSLFDGVAADIARVAPQEARVLEVGCGPGRLSILLARRYGLRVTGLDLDPEMIELARANAAAASDGDTPSFVVGNVSALSFPDESFDLVVSTLSMHHWTDVRAALSEIGRVLRPNGRALVWDLRRGFFPLHGWMPDPASHTAGTFLTLASSTAWRWPWRVSLLRRIELVRQ
ncbi:MAG TPA: class I SAM-dependent methyltransferase [Actinomycetota bacterium]|nr:class I SAM-dependent methyltransferase [Actinomycetota bacterium]